VGPATFVGVTFLFALRALRRWATAISFKTRDPLTPDTGTPISTTPPPMSMSYVHGYAQREAERLQDQSRTLAELLHASTAYPHGTQVLEAGCGTGAQTLELARRSPGARFTSIDISAESLEAARQRVATAGIQNVQVRQADITALPFAPASFDHVFVCFVLEHLPRPAQALSALARLLRPGGTLTVIEGDHGTACFHPDNPAARAAIGCQAELQRRAGGDAFIGRRLQPLLAAAGLSAVRVKPRTVYTDSSRPDLADAFTRRTFAAMIEGIRAPALAAGLTGPIRRRRAGPAPCSRARRHLLLHLLQGHGRGDLICLGRSHCRPHPSHTTCHPEVRWMRPGVTHPSAMCQS